MKELTQNHNGVGDNVAGDKITNNTVVNNILGKSVEYKALLTRIAELEEDLEAEIGNPERRLKKSAALNEARNQLEQFRQK